MGLRSRDLHLPGRGESRRQLDVEGFLHLLRRAEAKSSPTVRTGGGLGWQGQGRSEQARRARAGTVWRWRSGAGSTRGSGHRGRPISNSGSSAALSSPLFRFFLLDHLCFSPHPLAVPLPTLSPASSSLPLPLPPVLLLPVDSPPNCSLPFSTSSTPDLPQAPSPPSSLTPWPHLSACFPVWPLVLPSSCPSTLGATAAPHPLPSSSPLRTLPTSAWTI